MVRNGASATIACVQPVDNLHALRRHVKDYAASADPLTATSNRLALILASNQPFYPLYVRWVTGEAHALLALTLLSTPFFLASPWMARRFPDVGRLWFPAVGAINTFFCAFIFGEGSGVEWFLAPCLIIAVLSCRRTDMRALGAYVGALLCLFMLLHGGYGQPLYPMDATQQEALSSLNFYSASTLSVIAAWMFMSIRREQGLLIP